MLEKDGSKALLISRYALDCKPYHTNLVGVTWETCTLREWLNNDFLNAAFSAEVQSKIISSTVMADKNPSYGTSPGNDTTDKVFLLSIPEVNKYFNTDSDRICGATDYAVAQGAYTNGSYSADGKAPCWWWLRSPGDSDKRAVCVWCGGWLQDYGTNISLKNGIRPALWIDLES